MNRLPLILALWTLLAMAVQAQPEPLRVVASMAPAAHLAEMAGGDLIEVDTLMPPGASPHVWQPSMADMRRLADADLILLIGGGLEPWADELLGALGEGTNRIDLIDLLPADMQLHFEDAHGHDHGPVDPHFWLSVPRARAVSEALHTLLTAMIPGHAREFDQQWSKADDSFDRIERRLTRLREENTNGMGVITLHDAWAYMADDLGMKIVEVIEVTPGVEISPAAMRDLLDVAREERVQVVIAEPQMSPATAQQIAMTIGASLSISDPLGARAESWSDHMTGLADGMTIATMPIPDNSLRHEHSTAQSSRYPFVLPSFLVGAMVAILCGVLSVYVVLRRMAFIGQGIGHAAFGGVAIGLWLFPMAVGPLDWTVFSVAVIFCLLNAVAIGTISRKTALSEDTAIGILFVLSMAIGAIFFKLRQDRVADLFSYLFGSIVAVTWQDVATVAVLGAVVLFIAWLFSKELQFITFDEEAARVGGLPVDMLNHLLLALLSLTVVIAIKIVGIILVNAALVLPGATARLLTKTFGRMVAVAVVFGLVTTLIGLAIANFVDVPAGAAVVLVQSGAFGAVWFAKR